MAEDEWQVRDLDLSAYLSRIGIETTTLKPTLDTLFRIHKAHKLTIPFENLRMYTGKEVTIDMTEIQQKLLYEKRGGCCFEHNLLLGAALEQIGFKIRRVEARARFRRRVDGRYHVKLLVELPESDPDRCQWWIADCGMAATGLMEPIPFKTNTRFDQGPWSFRIVEETAGNYLLQSQHPGHPDPDEEGWRNMHEFWLSPIRRIDCVVAFFYISNYPTSHYRNRMIVQINRGYEQITLTDYTFERKASDDDVKIECVSDDLLDSTLRSVFDLHLPSNEIELICSVRERLAKEYSDTLKGKENADSATCSIQS